MAASAGRSISGSVFTTILASAISAPVLPAETTPADSRAATLSMAMRMELLRPCRSAAVGFISEEMTSGAWRIMQAFAARGRRASSAADPGLVADQQEAGLRMPLGGQLKPVQDDIGCVVTPHGVDRQGESIRHDLRFLAGRGPTAQVRTTPFTASAAITSRPS